MGFDPFSAIGSFFGGGKPPKNPYIDAAAGDVSSLAPYKNTFDTNAATAGGRVNALTPQTDASRNALISMLGRSASGDDRAAVAGSTFGNASTAYNNARARLAAQRTAAGGSSGITPGQNSFSAGQDVALENGMAGATAGALNTADAYERQRQQQALQAIYQVLTGARGEAVGEQNNALGAALGVNTTQINANMGLAGAKAQADAQAEAKRQGMLGLIAQVAQMYGLSGGYPGYRPTGGGAMPGSTGGYSYSGPTGGGGWSG